MNMGGGGNKLQNPMKRTIKTGWKFEQMEKIGFCDRLWKSFVTFMKNLFAWLFCFCFCFSERRGTIKRTVKSFSYKISTQGAYWSYALYRI